MVAPTLPPRMQGSRPSAPMPLSGFVRPVSFQNFPDTLLPEELKESNPLKIWRYRNSDWVKGWCLKVRRWKLTNSFQSPVTSFQFHYQSPVSTSSLTKTFKIFSALIIICFLIGSCANVLAQVEVTLQSPVSSYQSPISISSWQRPLRFSPR